MTARHFLEFDTWGTVIVFDLSSATIAEEVLIAAAHEAQAYFFHIDEVFSTYKPESMISRLRRNEIRIEDCTPEVQEVWSACAVARDLSNGAFDPWIVAGGFDPSGYVKGWASDKACEIFLSHGIENSLVNSGGDVTVRGGYLKDGVVAPWSVGIRNPLNKAEIVHTVELNNGAIATSGTYERGAHIKDPHSNLIAIGARSATVIGPDGGLADALATALIVDGRDGAGWFSRPELADYTCWVVDRNDDTSWTFTK